MRLEIKWMFGAGLICLLMLSSPLCPEGVYYSRAWGDQFNYTLTADYVSNLGGEEEKVLQPHLRTVIDGKLVNDRMGQAFLQAFIATLQSGTIMPTTSTSGANTKRRYRGTQNFNSISSMTIDMRKHTYNPVFTHDGLTRAIGVVGLWHFENRCESIACTHGGRLARKIPLGDLALDAFG